MSIYNLSAIKGRAGIVFACPKCKTAASSAYGAQNRDQLAYLLVCEKCGDILAEWASPDVRDDKLRDLAKRIQF